jgi:non-canonical (house-cleaning) NTP pyrophosphatase
MITKQLQSISPSTTIIVLGSLSAIKHNAVASAFSKYDVAIVRINADSKVNTQPVEEETFIGVNNRITDAKNQYLQDKLQNSFFVIAIENGIFNYITEGKEVWEDKAIIVAELEDGTKIQQLSEAVMFPTEYVDIAKNSGFDIITVSKVMAEMNVVTRSDDPHLSLTGKSRQQYLEEALEELVAVLAERKIIHLKYVSSMKSRYKV